MKRFALSVCLIFTLVLVAVIAWRLSNIVFLVLASLAIAAAVRGPLVWLMEHRVPRGLAVLALYGLILLVFGALGYLLFQTLGRELGSITEDLSTVYRTLAIRWGGAMVQNLPALTARLPSPEQIGQLLANEDLGELLPRVAGMTGGVVSFLTNASVALILSIYWIADRLRFERLLLSLLPVSQRARARSIWYELENGVGAYLRSELVQGILAAMLLAPAFMLMGLKYPVFWALTGALTWFIPLVGALLFVIPLWLIVFVQNGAWIATLAVVYSLAVLWFLEFIVERKLYKPEGRSNILVLLVMLIMTDAFGLIGLLLSPPLAMAIYILVSQLLEHAAAAGRATELEPEVATLEDRLAQVRSTIGELDGGAAPRLASMSERLADLLARAKEMAR